LEVECVGVEGFIGVEEGAGAAFVFSFEAGDVVGAEAVFDAWPEESGAGDAEEGGEFVDGVAGGREVDKGAEFEKGIAVEGDGVGGESAGGGVDGEGAAWGDDCGGFVEARVGGADGEAPGAWGTLIRVGVDAGEAVSDVGGGEGGPDARPSGADGFFQVVHKEIVRILLGIEKRNWGMGDSRHSFRTMHSGRK
jgi:hypothetical protein